MKELMEFDYVEVDGLLHPRIEIDGKKVLDDLGKYGEDDWSICGSVSQGYIGSCW